jgi:hypothetical protein
MSVHVLPFTILLYCTAPNSASKSSEFLLFADFRLISHHNFGYSVVPSLVDSHHLGGYSVFFLIVNLLIITIFMILMHPP